MLRQIFKSTITLTGYYIKIYKILQQAGFFKKTKNLRLLPIYQHCCIVMI